MHINKTKKNNLTRNPVLSKRVGLTLLSTLLLTSCSDTSLPPLFGGRENKEVIVQDPEQYQQSVSLVTEDTPRALTGQTNNKNLFAKSLRSDNERLSRLERSVQSLRNDFDTVQPSIRRLMAIESDIQELIGELRDLSEETTRVEPAPVPQVQAMQDYAPKITAPKQTSYQRKSAPPVEGGKTTIYDVRSGEHPGKSRLVLDTNSTASYTVDIDNNENVMVVDLPNSEWTAAPSKTFPKSSIITSYNVEKSETGNLLIIQLRKNARIGYQATLPSNSGAGKRIVLDVVSQ